MSIPKSYPHIAVGGERWVAWYSTRFTRHKVTLVKVLED